MNPQMPRRTREHELRDAAVLAFRSRFPRWAIRSTEENDYGIDAEVELFDDLGFATGMTFKAQIKGTDIEMKRGKIGARVSRTTLNYWRSLEVPVIVFIFSTPRGQAFARWAHSFDPANENSRPVAPSSKTLTFPFRSTHSMQALSLERLTEELYALRALRERVSLGPIPVRVQAKAKDVSGPALAEIEAELISAFALNSIFRLTDDDNAASATIDLATEKVRFGMPADLASTTFRWSTGESIQLDSPTTLAADLLMLAACTLSTVGLHQQARIIIEEFAGRSSYSHLADFTGGIVLSYLDQGDPTGAVQLILPMLIDSEASYRDMAEFSVAPLILGDTSDLTSEARDDLIDALRASAYIEMRADLPGLGANRIYLASSLARAHRKFDTAIALLQGLPSWESSYEDRGYYYRELGGALADSGRWHEAAENYARALTTPDERPRDIRFVHADALLYSGRYRACLDAAVQPDSDPIFVAKMRIVREVARFVVDVIGVEQQDRCQLIQVATPDGEAEFLPPSTSTVEQLSSYDALDIHLTNCLIADIESRSEVDQYALGLFAVKSWLELNNTTAWLLAITMAVELNDQKLAAAMADSMYQFCRPDVQRSMSVLRQQMSPEEFAQVRSVVNSAGRRESYQPPNLIRVFRGNEAPIIFSVDGRGQLLQAVGTTAET